MYETILVPLDGSKRAEKILPHVEVLAQCMNSRLIFLQVVAPVYYVMDPQVSYVDINVEETKWRSQEAEAYLDNLNKKYEKKGIQVSTRVEQGPMVETICEVAREEDVNLIAMASHGRTGLAQVFYGGVASGILNRVDRPLLLIRSRGGE